jgi:hypothetical protein
MAQITYTAAGATSVLNVPAWINQSVVLDPRTGAKWIPYYPDGGTIQPGINDTNAFIPQANPVVFRNPA